MTEPKCKCAQMRNEGPAVMGKDGEFHLFMCPVGIVANNEFMARYGIQGIPVPDDDEPSDQSEGNKS